VSTESIARPSHSVAVDDTCSSCGAPLAVDQRYCLECGERRDALAEEVTVLHWDLGGLAYEMAIRDHFRLDVLVRRAAVLQERDAELAELERLLHMEEGAVAGSCPRCAAPHSRGALFCWQCGATLMERAASVAFGEPESSTAVMDALLAPDPPDPVGDAGE
jgi:predicted RNA-binding Zn-ribbon protein involved in translation (DUF1610 family)